LVSTLITGWASLRKAVAVAFKRANRASRSGCLTPSAAFVVPCRL
jgi:hypothetical protein